MTVFAIQLMLLFHCWFSTSLFFPWLYFTWFFFLFHQFCFSIVCLWHNFHSLGCLLCEYFSISSMLLFNCQSFTWLSFSWLSFTSQPLIFHKCKASCQLPRCLYFTWHLIIFHRTVFAILSTLIFYCQSFPGLSFTWLSFTWLALLFH